MQTEKVWSVWNGTKVFGFETREEAEAKVQDLRAAYQWGYGFYLKTPPTQAEDGTWYFIYSKGSSCD